MMLKCIVLLYRFRNSQITSNEVKVFFFFHVINVIKRGRVTNTEKMIVYVMYFRYFIFTSFWAYKIYYVYGFMLLVFIILMIVTVCVTIVCTYFLLNAEDYRW